MEMDYNKKGAVLRKLICAQLRRQPLLIIIFEYIMRFVCDESLLYIKKPECFAKKSIHCLI